MDSVSRGQTNDCCCDHRFRNGRRLERYKKKRLIPPIDVITTLILSPLPWFPPIGDVG
jgi:hypothetical protein